MRRPLPKTLCNDVNLCKGICKERESEQLHYNICSEISRERLNTLKTLIIFFGFTKSMHLHGINHFESTLVLFIFSGEFFLTELIRTPGYSELNIKNLQISKKVFKQTLIACIEMILWEYKNVCLTYLS